MLRQRVLVTFLFLPLGIAAIFAGPVYSGIMMTVIFALAAYEFGDLFKAGGLQPSRFLIVGGVAAICLARIVWETSADVWLFPLLAMLVLVEHIIHYERGRDMAGSDFIASLGGIFYIGLLGSYYILLRALPEGEWWMLFTFFGIWLADSGAYFIGTKWGRHKLAPRLSPKKSWEGYWGGLLVAVIFMPLMVLLCRQLGLTEDSAITLPRSVIIGVLLALFPTLGDLGESMIKRQVGVKDSSHLLPGHGGMFDRVDSWLWGGVIGYFLIVWFFL